MSPRDTSPVPAEVLAELHGATVRFGTHVALSEVSATFRRGESVALVGPNGSGKTTLLRLVGGLVAVSSGEVTRTAGMRIGHVAQHQHQHSWMPLTVHEVLCMSRYRDRGLLRPLRAADRAAVDRAAGRLEVADLGSRTFGELSGGQRQRVLVAAALAGDPDVLLLDEPITGLDLPSQQAILDVITAERAAGLLVMVSTHDLDEARHCNRVMLLHTRLVADGTPAEVLRREPLSEAFGAHLLEDIPLLDDHGHGSPA